jgi:hypothetical protein
MLRNSLAEITILDALLGAGDLPGRQSVHVQCPAGAAKFVVDGGLVECCGASWMADNSPASVVVFELMRNLDGEVVIESSPQEPLNVPVGVATLLRGIEMLASEWQSLMADVPSMESVVRLWPELSRSAVVLDARWWALVQAVGTGTTFAALMMSLELDELNARRTLAEALAWGLVSVDGRAGRALTPRQATGENAPIPAPLPAPAMLPPASIGSAARS